MRRKNLESAQNEMRSRQSRSARRGRKPRMIETMFNAKLQRTWRLVARSMMSRGVGSTVIAPVLTEVFGVAVTPTDLEIWMMRGMPLDDAS